MYSDRDIVNAVRLYGGFRPAARKLEMPESTLRRRWNNSEVVSSNITLEQFERELELKDALTQQRKVNRILARQHIDAKIESTVLDTIVNAKIKTPKWATPKKRSSGFVGTPTLFLSDWHYSEVVRPTEIGGMNHYDTTEAKKRLRTTIENTIELCSHYTGADDFPGIVVVLGGDMFSGDIHAELKETNESPSLVALFDFAAELKVALKTLADTFGNVFVPCVAGNHGRLTHKPQFKNAAATNIDWALYRLLEEQFKDDERVTFLIPDGPDAVYKIYNTVYCLTHGDKMGTAGGGGNVGIYGPVVRGVDKIVRQYHDIGVQVDCVIMGHWHQYIPHHRFIVNGSGKGPDEYSMGMRFKPEAPMQALWLTHPKYGITTHMPVFCTDEGHNFKVMEEGKTDWISVMG